MSEAALTPPEETDGEQDYKVRFEKFVTKFEQVYEPILRETVPELQRENEEKDERIGELSNRVDELEAQLESLIGVPEEDASTHSKRIQDTKHVLQRRAATSNDRASMYWREIASSLAEHGHGELYDTQVKRIMEDVSDAQGFTLATGKRDVSTTDDRSDVREVQVVRVELDDVPGSGAINNVVGGGAEAAGSQDPVETNQSTEGT